jgi:hypothetical protein
MTGHAARPIELAVFLQERSIENSAGGCSSDFAAAALAGPDLQRHPTVYVAFVAPLAERISSSFQVTRFL